MTTTNIVAAAEAFSSGLSPSAFFSIARFNERNGNADVGQAARKVARELAQMMGIDLGGRRRAANNNAARGNRRAA